MRVKQWPSKLLLLSIVHILSCQKNATSSRTSGSPETSEDAPDTSEFQLLSGPQLVAAGLICQPVSGAPKGDQGSGACAGNVHIPMDLSALYPGLALHYNSTYNVNRFGFGKNVTLSDMSLVYLPTGAGAYVQLGNGEYVPFTAVTSGSFAGKWFAENRAETTAFLEKGAGPNSTPELVRQIEWGGNQYFYSNITGDLWGLKRSTNRFGETMTLNLYPFAGAEFIQYADGTRITITRSGATVRFSRDARNFAVLTKNGNGTIKSVDVTSADGVVSHNFEYSTTNTNPNLIATYLQRQRGILEEKFEYSYSGDFVTKVKSADSPDTIFERVAASKSVRTQNADGTILEETFDASGRISGAKHFVAGHLGDPISEATFTYDNLGRRTRVTLPRGRVDYRYDTAEPQKVVGTTTYIGGVVMNTATYTRAPASWVTTSEVATGKGGVPEKNIRTTWTTAWPYLPTRIENTLAGTDTRFVYDGNRTTASYFKKTLHPTSKAEQMTLVREEIYDRRKLVTTTNPLLPQDRRVTTLTYNNKDRLTGVASGGKSAQLGYNADGLPISYTEPNGTRHTRTYDANGYLLSETTIFPTGVSETHTYNRTFRADGSVAKVDKEVSAPSGSERVSYEYDSLEAGGDLLTTKKNEVEVYKRY